MYLEEIQVLVNQMISKKITLQRDDDNTPSGIKADSIMVAIGSNMYIFGGISSTGKSNDIWNWYRW